MKLKQNSKGFTLIEILIVITITGILGFILTDLLTQVLRGQNKINTVSLVKQNGQVILDKLSNEIRSAENLICVDTNSNNPGQLNDTIVLFRNGNYSRIRFRKPEQGINLKNGYFTKEDFTKDDIPDDLNDPQLCTDNSLKGQISYITDKETNGISINYYDDYQPIFEKQFQLGFPDLILIKFKASEDVNAGKTAESTVTTGGVLFTTAVSVRGGK